MTTQLAAEKARMSSPIDGAPLLDLRLTDADRVVGWVAGDAVGFRGFANETEAVHAAWIAYRTMARRIGHRGGSRRVHIETEPLALQRFPNEEMILASGNVLGRLLRPGNASRSGADSFGFEIRVPAPADELTVRSTAYLMYRTLRKSGARWGLWQPAGEKILERDAGRASGEISPDETRNAGLRDASKHRRRRLLPSLERRRSYGSRPARRD